MVTWESACCDSIGGLFLKLVPFGGPLSISKKIRFAASVGTSLAIALVRRSFARIRSEISRSVRRANSATTLKPMQPPRQNWRCASVAKGAFQVLSRMISGSALRTPCPRRELIRTRHFTSVFPTKPSAIPVRVFPRFGNQVLATSFCNGAFSLRLWRDSCFFQTLAEAYLSTAGRGQARLGDASRKNG